MHTRRAKRQTSAYIYAGSAVLITSLIIAFPDDSFRASLEGLRVWWEIVFPALLPFFITAEILMGLGVVHMMGILLEPLMRPVFNVPGVGAFALAMGLASGYPIGAKITGQLRTQRMCSRVEAERLLSISNTADPLFMIGAVAVGMFGDAQLGATLALSHYAASILLGLIMRFYGRNDDESKKPKETRKSGLIRRALDELVSARDADGRSIGQLLGDAVRDSVSTLLLVGGFIILFSVVTRIVSVVGITQMIAAPLSAALKPFGVDPSLMDPLVKGFFEITIGCDAASKATASLFSRVITASAVIAWSGLSVHAQVASLIHKTDIRLHAYIGARVIHSVLAAGVSVLILHFGGVPKPASGFPVLAAGLVPGTTVGASLFSSAKLLCAVLACASLVGLITSLPLSLKIVRFRHSVRR